tara:strand:+ start:3457 stop:3603 length:147 start_codon:yes stop_codon:yes gene_type:complete
MAKKSNQEEKWEHAEKLADLYTQRSQMEVALIKLNGAIEVLEAIKPKE